MKVRTASRSTGGVVMSESSRTPVSAICKVRGIGVAVRVSTCTLARSAFSRSLCLTPKCCSSSMMSRPRSRNFVPSVSSAWVPTTMSMSPVSIPLRTSAISLRGVRREACAIFIGRPLKRSVNVAKCWRASSVVGTTTATCAPDIAATNAERSATSVLPNPTSPHTSRSMGLPEPMSAITASIAES